MSKDENDNKIGYRRPPVHARFKPGQSGNVRGRPKGSANLKSDLRDELSEQIRVREGERDLKVSKQRAMLKALVAKALKGDARASSVLLGLIVQHLMPEVAEAASRHGAQDDLALLDAYVEARIAERDAAARQSSPTKTSKPQP